MIDVILPTIRGREESARRCQASYLANTAPGCLTFIIIHDEPTCGKAWRKGLELSTAPYVHLTCDDLEMTSPTWGGVCMETVDKGLLPAPIVRRPNGSIESCGGDMSAPACLISRLLADREPVDFTTVPFYSREMAERIGMHEGHYMTDVYASHMGRKFGYETVVRHGYEFVHHHEMAGRRTPDRGDQKAYDEAMSV